MGSFISEENCEFSFLSLVFVFAVIPGCAQGLHWSWSLLAKVIQGIMELLN